MASRELFKNGSFLSVVAAFLGSLAVACGDTSGPIEPPRVPHDTIPPIVEFLNPADSARVSGLVSIIVFAHDPNNVTNLNDDGRIVSVELFVDAVSFSIDSALPYTFDWNTTTVVNSWHILRAVVVDSAGNTAADTIRVLVNNQLSSLFGTALKACATENPSACYSPSSVFPVNTNVDVNGTAWFLPRDSELKVFDMFFGEASCANAQTFFDLCFGYWRLLDGSLGLSHSARDTVKIKATIKITTTDATPPNFPFITEATAYLADSSYRTLWRLNTSGSGGGADTSVARGRLDATANYQFHRITITSDTSFTVDSAITVTDGGSLPVSSGNTQIYYALAATVSASEDLNLVRVGLAAASCDEASSPRGCPTYGQVSDSYLSTNLGRNVAIPPIPFGVANPTLAVFEIRVRGASGSFSRRISVNFVSEGGTVSANNVSLASPASRFFNDNYGFLRVRTPRLSGIR